MIKRSLFTGAAVVLASVTILLGQQSVHSNSAAVLARGKYLVENIGLALTATRR